MKARCSWGRCEGRTPLCEGCERDAVDTIHIAHLSSGLPGTHCPRCLSQKHHTRRDMRRSARTPT